MRFVQDWRYDRNILYVFILYILYIVIYIPKYKKNTHHVFPDSIYNQVSLVRL